MGREAASCSPCVFISSSNSVCVFQSVKRVSMFLSSTSYHYGGSGRPCFDLYFLLKKKKQPLRHPPRVERSGPHLTFMQMVNGLHSYGTFFVSSGHPKRFTTSPHIHPFTHRRRRQPCRATPSWEQSGWGVRCIVFTRSGNKNGI